MIVYGDRISRLDPRERIEAIRARLESLPAPCLGLAGHAALVAAFIEACELEQGVADRAFEESGLDAPSNEREACGALIMGLAHAIGRSWRKGFCCSHRSLWLPPILILETLLSRDGPISGKQAEGYAFYAVYPELYYEAAAALPRGVGAEVIGLRSIGNGLASIAAARWRAPAPITLRPFGPPFERRVAASEAFEARLRAADTIAIADEGPGLSGSSFFAVAELLERFGKPLRSLHFMPSHSGEPGAEAGPERRLKWRSARRHIAEFESHIACESPCSRLAQWVSDLTGPALRPLEDLAGGAWRERLCADERFWPPSYAQQERRKYLLSAADGVFLLKFAGLGRAGERKLELASRLYEHGFAPETLGLRHGFLVERWREDAHALSEAEVHSPDFILRVADYLAFRERSFPARDGGASARALAHMAAHNIKAGLNEPPRCLAPWLDRLEDYDRRFRPVTIDGRLHRWEWLRTRCGRILKTDALDHHASHDLIGCQDIAWDLAGALVEFSLSDSEREILLRRFEERAYKCVDRETLAFLRICYASFQLGLWHMAAGSADDHDEARRARAARERYAQDLARTLRQARA